MGRGVKRDGREEFVPKQYAAEKKCKIAAERNQKNVAAKEGERKKKMHAQQVEKAKETANKAIEAEKEAKYKLEAQTEQLAKKRDEPAAKEKDVKEKQHKTKRKSEGVVKKTGSAIETVKVQLDNSEATESAAKTALKLTIARNENGAKKEKKHKLE